MPDDFSTEQRLYFVWLPAEPESPPRIYRSGDAGSNWELLEDTLPPVASVNLDPDGTALVAQTANGDTTQWSLDRLTWQTDAHPPLMEIPVEQLLVLPGTTGKPSLYAVSRGSGVLLSDDGGATWTETGFPVRFDIGEPEPLVSVAPDSHFIGTPLGLYHLDGDRDWTPVEGGLPYGLSASSPIVNQDDSMLVFVDAQGQGRDLRTFQSIDGGQSWTEALPQLPAHANIDDVVFSPFFASDRTAFVATFWSTPYRSVGGGMWERFGPPGAVTANQVYAAFRPDQEATLFVEADDTSLWRSDDGGDTWIQLSTPWGASSISGLTFSPEFAQDGTLWVLAEGGLYRSIDQGTLWTHVLELLRSNPQFLFPSGYRDQGEMFVLQNGNLYHSADQGQTWRLLDQTPWGSGDIVRLFASPVFDQDRTLLAWLRSGLVYRSSDGGDSWDDSSRGIPPGDITNVLFSPAYATDGTVYLLTQDGGIYRQVRSGPWHPITEQSPEPTPEPTPVPSPTPLPRPLASPTPMICSKDPIRFKAVWQLPDVQSRLGCPIGQAEQFFLAEQPFEQGRMFWDSSTRQIYVLSQADSWQAFEDTWNDDQPATDPALTPPQGLVQPQRGFGKVWRDQLGGPEAAIGWAREEERSVQGWRQSFEKGLLLWSDDLPEALESGGTAYLLYADGRWQAVAAPEP